MTVIVNDGSAVAQYIALQANTGPPKRPNADALGDWFWRVDVEDSAALREDAGRRHGIDRAIFAHVVGAAKETIVRP